MPKKTPDYRGQTAGMAAVHLQMKPKYDQGIIDGTIDPNVPYSTWLDQQLSESSKKKSKLFDDYDRPTTSPK